MATSRRSIKLTINKADLAQLESMRGRGRRLLAGRKIADSAGYRQDPSFYAVAQTMGLHAQTVQRCIERAKAEGALAALDERAVRARSRRSPSRPKRGW